jgi:hypothetical protein
MTYSKSCNRCGSMIFMAENNGKWSPFDDQSTTIHHRCPSNITSTLEEKISHLEKIVRKLNDRIQLQSESLRKLGI